MSLKPFKFKTFELTQFMKMASPPTRLGLATLIALLSPAAVAADSGWYGGINLGRTDADIDNERIGRNLLGNGFTAVQIVEDERDVGFKLFGGYQFNRHFAMEGGYFDLGQFSYRANTVPVGTLNGDIRLKGVNLDMVGILPLSDKIALLGRVGLAYTEAKDNFNGSGLVRVLNANPEKREANYKMGLGLQYKISEALRLRLEAERYRVNDAVGNKGDIDLISIGLAYGFGGPSPPRLVAVEPIAAVQAPAPVSATPPPTPPPPPLPPPQLQPAPPPAPSKVSFSADALFDFDKSTLKPAGKQALDAFAVQIKSTRFDQIAVTGHTDRIGARAYNLNLSSRRAEAVKAYLVTSAGIPDHKFTVRGVNSDQPVTKPADCPGPKSRRDKALIACLQPDRRVDVEVSGTR